MSENKSLTSRLPVEKFKHSNMTMSRADKWSEFKTSLKSAFGQFFPLLAAQLDHECDPRGGFNTNFTHSDILEPCTLIHFGWWEISIENQNVWGREILVSSIFVGLCSLSMCTYSDVVGVI